MRWPTLAEAEADQTAADLRFAMERARELEAEIERLRSLLRQAEPYLVEFGPASLWTEVCAGLASETDAEEPNPASK